MPERNVVLRQIGEDILAELRKQAKETGVHFESAIDDVADFIAMKADELSRAVGKPGFDEALIAARDSVLLKAAGRAVIEGDRFDDILRATARSALAIVARLLVMI